MVVTTIFDAVCDVVVDNNNIPFEAQKEIVEVLYNTLKDEGWSDEKKSAYSTHVWVAEVLDIEFDG